MNILHEHKDETALSLRLAVLLPLALVLYLFIRNRQYPIGDPADYMMYIQRSYLVLREEGLFAMLKSLYTMRTWKTIFHPVCVLPALFTTGGNVRRSIALTNLTAFGIFLAYAFRAARQFLPNRRAVPLVWFAGTLPWVLKSATQFGYEIYFMAAGMASVHYLLRDVAFRSPGNGARLGLSLGFAALFQPFLALVSVGGGFLAAAAGAFRSRTLNLAMLSPLLPIFGALVLLMDQTPNLRGSKMALAAFLFFLWFWGWHALLRRKGLSRAFFWAVLIPFTMSFLWFAPLLHTMIIWAVGCTTSVSTYYANAEPPSFRTGLLSHFGGPFLLVLLAVLAWGNDRLALRRAWPLLPVVAAPPLLRFFFYNYDSRYYYFGFTLLFLCAGAAALSFNGRKGIFAKTAFLAGAAGSAFVSLWLVFAGGAPVPLHLDTLYNYSSFPMAPVPDADHASRLIDEMQKRIDMRQRKRVLVVGATGTASDNAALTIISREKGFQMVFVGAWWMLEMHPLPRLKDLRGYCDYVFIDLRRQVNWNPMFTRLNETLYAAWEQGELGDNGLRAVAEIQVDNNRLLLAEFVPTP